MPFFLFSDDAKRKQGLTGKCEKGNTLRVSLYAPKNRAIKRKGERKMRKYKNGGQLETVMCNCCGKKIIVSEGVAREGVISINHTWDFFSEKDGEIHHFDLCEDCYDTMIQEFKIPVEVEEQLEYL
ncbi:hypothetical protein Closa_0626 [[Clostridium] saccharolyticum WM1]|uniref:Uncharacterized protein n=2 Tax=Lacrimispora TaxID=2719231 RepID=D9R4S0_LACSW|nr:hypothetical protein Closa_0626 [[Clostridium] saccharolyticum WM1]